MRQMPFFQYDDFMIYFEYTGCLINCARISKMYKKNNKVLFRCAVCIIRRVKVSDLMRQKQNIVKFFALKIPTICQVIAKEHSDKTICYSYYY